MTDPERDRIAGREWAEAVLEDLAQTSDEYKAGFMRRMLKEFQPDEIDRSAMTDEQARAFGRQVVNFGVHRDKCYDDVPLEYLEWLVDENTALARYIRSRRIKAEQDEEEEI